MTTEQQINCVMLFLKYQNVPLEAWPPLISSRVGMTTKNVRNRWLNFRAANTEIFPDGGRKVMGNDIIAFITKHNLGASVEKLRLQISSEEEEKIKMIDPTWSRGPVLGLNAYSVAGGDLAEAGTTAAGEGGEGITAERDTEVDDYFGSGDDIREDSTGEYVADYLSW